MQRMQRQQYQVRADFKEHFRKVWTSSVKLKQGHKINVTLLFLTKT